MNNDLVSRSSHDKRNLKEIFRVSKNTRFFNKQRIT